MVIKEKAEYSVFSVKIPYVGGNGEFKSAYAPQALCTSLPITTLQFQKIA